MDEKLKAKLKTLPEKPGSYQMKDKSGRIIYVGKAKNLHNRVNQYFVGAHDYKTTRMVASVADFDYIVTSSEKEALLLESNLIKKIRPRFNIMLMDDASYPYLRLTKEKYPTLEVVRDLKKHADARYFGPYPDVAAARNTYDLLQSIYPLRKCRTMPKKVCLYYHMGQCLGPCEYDVDPAEYQKMYQGLVTFLNGDTREVERQLREKRDEASRQLKYEEAGKYQKMLDSLHYVTSRQGIDYDERKSVDAFNCYYEKGFIALQGLFVRRGQLLDRTFQLRLLYEEPYEALESFVSQYYLEHPVPQEVLLPRGMDIGALNEALGGKARQPQRGQYRKLVELAGQNAKTKLEQQLELSQKELLQTEKAMSQLRSLIGGKDAHVIEMFDNSHISGKDAVAGLVVYRDGRADKSSYRRYKVHEGADDLANMKEVIYRRYYRLLMERKELPDILLVDGGYGQIQAASEVLQELGLKGKITVLGAVKDERHRTASVMDEEGKTLPIRPDSDLFFLITRMQDEVHRFAITYHRKLRSKEQTHSELDDIRGVGPIKKKKLMNELGSFAAIRDASREQLESIVDRATAHAVYAYFHPEEGKSIIRQEENGK